MTFEERWERSQGWLSVIAYPMQDGGIAISSRDITQQKNTEERLEQALRERDRPLALLDTFSPARRSGSRCWTASSATSGSTRPWPSSTACLSRHPGAQVREALPNLPDFVNATSSACS